MNGSGAIAAFLLGRATLEPAYFTKATNTFLWLRATLFEPTTGKVYDNPCHRIMGHSEEMPNTDWVAENHWCVPLYYRPESREAARQSALLLEPDGTLTLLAAYGVAPALTGVGRPPTALNTLR